MSTKEAEQSAWVHYFSQALSDLTGMTDEYSDNGVKIAGPAQADSLTNNACKIADAAVRTLKDRKIPEEYWPTASS